MDIFKTFVRPVKNPVLDPFCTFLTGWNHRVQFAGITQQQVDEAPLFPEAVELFREWLIKHRLGESGRRYAFVTDGEFDFARYIQNECLEKLGYFPHDFRYFIDIKKIFNRR